MWYAGAYTNQICTIPPDTGNALVHLGEPGYSSTDDQSPVNVTWYNNYTITKGTSVLVDGAKRDRLVWAGGTLQNMDEDAGTGSLTNLYRHGHSSACRCGIYR